MFYFTKSSVSENRAVLLQVFEKNISPGLIEFNGMLAGVGGKGSSEVKGGRQEGSATTQNVKGRTLGVPVPLPPSPINDRAKARIAKISTASTLGYV